MRYSKIINKIESENLHAKQYITAQFFTEHSKQTVEIKLLNMTSRVTDGKPSIASPVIKTLNLEKNTIPGKVHLQNNPVNNFCHNTKLPTNK